ncbi:MAG: SDR family NAD(P)-dependent oxidoreductase [Fibrobacter sp.]|jgi:CDP-paratose 2-epimerase|nr:SDR family NAD(P)-dependent oxidoreductase [Fibrobacter sp.]
MKTGQKVVVTGGAGFIGTNLCHRLASDGYQVLLYDNLSRKGSEKNLKWLIDTHGSSIQARIADVRDQKALREALDGAQRVYHFAAQVAVTRSLDDPLEDFEINLRGTVNVLEILREAENPPFLLFTSTNKVYGRLGDLQLIKENTRYRVPDNSFSGIGESRLLDFHSPYGCSKGGADQYVIDYARTFGIPATVFRMSCIYGPHQFGNEDQGWVAHLLFRAVEKEPITIYGDGRQVRDLLFIDDLVEAFLNAYERREKCAGEAFTIGGGIKNTLSILELLESIKKLHGDVPNMVFAPWRTGDQKFYVSDLSKFHKLTGWEPSVGTLEGISRLYRWIVESGRRELSLMEKEGVA